VKGVGVGVSWRDERRDFCHTNITTITTVLGGEGSQQNANIFDIFDTGGTITAALRKQPDFQYGGATV